MSKLKKLDGTSILIKLSDIQKKFLDINLRIKNDECLDQISSGYNAVRNEFSNLLGDLEKMGFGHAQDYDKIPTKKCWWAILKKLLINNHIEDNIQHQLSKHIPFM